MKVAINGVGIAGPTLAYWLHRFGHEPVLIEKAPQLRTGGYVVDFWGIGYDIAEKMGLIPKLMEQGYNVQEVRWVNARGHTVSRFDLDIFRQMTKDRYVSLERSDLAAAIYSTIAGEVETIFGDSIANIEHKDDGVHVTFEQTAPRNFDLVVGADGLHSRVRDLVFGPIEQFEQDLGLRVVAFELEGYRPRNELEFISHTEPGRQISRFSKRNNKTLFLFGFRNRFASDTLPTTDEQRKQVLKRVFADVGWECPRVLSAIENVDNIYFDRVSQIHMQHWTKGRTALVGDAAAAVSLLAGEGAGLAIAEAYVLAGELSRAKNEYPIAFAQYEKRLIPFIESKQSSVSKVASTLVPNTRLDIIVRNWATRLFHGPFLAKLGLGNLVDDIELPVYEQFSNETN